jgi:hypothetical protein
MTVTDSRRADQKRVRFPPPKAWDPDAKWTQDCVMFRVCEEKHPPGKCDAFKKLSPQQRLKEINNRELCWLCYLHLRGRDCWSKDKVPNCGVEGCEAAHHHLLHGTLVEGRVMVVQGIDAGKAHVFLCLEDIRVEAAGKASHLHALYDWGATVTLVTHAAAEKAGLERRRQTPAAPGACRRRQRQGESREGPGREQHHDAGSCERARGNQNKASTSQGLCGEACQASGGCGDAGRHGQPGLDSHACGEQPG